jgi:sucrose-6-phosphate hydrolase SacC (GH32 family)
MWYTGYDGERQGKKMLGYAVSSDGLHWTPLPDNPIYSTDWVEDVQVIRHGGQYFMFAEGRDDIAQLLVSPDGLSWKRVGPLDIRLKNGEPIPAGPRGTPAAYFEDGLWRLYYERRDLGVWLATSRDMQVWTNVSDDPVLAMGPDAYDKHAVAMNQILKYQGQYYGYYHASDSDQPGRKWSTCLAQSADLVTWHKYPKNPILRDNKSSGIVVEDGAGGLRLYTMHDVVQVHLPAPPAPGGR